MQSAPPLSEDARAKPLPWIVRGDIDGFFGLALDNFVQLLLIYALCKHVVGFSDELLLTRVLPGAAVSLLVGNIYYAFQARELALRTGRTDVCALPYGINTVSVFAHVFFVMLPAKLDALKLGAADPALEAWRAGLVACFASGIIEMAGSFFAETLRKSTPRAALLSTLAGIALSFISLGFLFRTFANPLVGLTTFAIISLAYFGRMRFRGGLASGLIAILVGTALAWLTGLVPVKGAPPPEGLSLHLPIPFIGDLIEAFRGPYLLRYLTIIVPMGLFNLIGSLQNIESAEAAGDLYATRPSLLVNGSGSLAAALFGSCFPTTIYIGHPGWKAMGARSGYSILNGLVVTLICITGALNALAYVVPIDAGMAILLWIGIVITAQAFQAVPKDHAPAVVVGLLPGVAAWGALLIKISLRVAGQGVPGKTDFSEKLVDAFKVSDQWIQGAFALDQGFIFSATILAAATVAVIERRFRLAAGWCVGGAALCAFGLMHSYEFTPSDTAMRLLPNWPWYNPFVLSYLLMALIFFTAQWTTVEGEGH